MKTVSEKKTYGDEDTVKTVSVNMLMMVLLL
jgi:hypothetical protein